MNILADKQKKLVETISVTEEYGQCYKEFIPSYYQLRDKEERCWYSRLLVRQRQILHS